MLYDQIRQDILYLAGRLEHRAAHSKQERDAAEYIEKRLRENCPNVTIEDFHTAESLQLLFALFYGEFVVATFFGVWFPMAAFAYACVVFLAYMAEFMGYRVISRFMPPFESQNVVARFYAAKPRKQFIIMANYDSGAASPMTHPNFIGFWRPVHLLLLFCMVLIIATLAVDSLRLNEDYILPTIIRWCAATVLGLGAFLLFLNSGNAEDIRGANGNASGVSAILDLAKRFHDHPMVSADLWLVFTGSHEVWMSGAQYFFNSHNLDKDNTYVLNLECVGSGKLHYLQEEGMLSPQKASAAMLEAIHKVISQENTTNEDAPAPAELFSIPTGAHIPLARGFNALTIMGLDECYLPLHWNWEDDNIGIVDERLIGRCSDFAEKLLRELEKDCSQH